MTAKTVDYIIVGQGLAGSILAYKLQEKGASVCIVDDGYRSSASLVAAGLIDYISGQRLTMSWRASTFIPYAVSFYQSLTSLFNTSFYFSRPAMRLFATESEYKIWQKKRSLPEFNAFYGNNYLLQHDYKLLLFTPDRNKIYSRVNKRFLKMMNNGAIDEVKKLISLNLDKTLPIMKAHGVPEISSYLLKSTNLDECILKGQQVTRNYVKRQDTWRGSTNLEIHQQIKEFPDEIELNSIKMPIS